MSASPLSLLPAYWAIGLALGSLNVTMSLSFARKLWKLPRAGTPLLRLQIEKLKLNENAMSPQQKREADVVWLQRR